MKFGLFVCLQLPRPWSEGSERLLFEEALEQVELADRLGIDYVWAQEHHFLEEYSHSCAPEVFLGACSQRTKRIRLGQGIAVMSPRFNPPARVAERIATLDLLSGGRVEWGTGESGSRLELEGFGVDFVDKRPAWAEAVRETAKMLCMEPYPGYEGRYFSMPARNVVPKPVQKPHPPLWAACSNRDNLKLAARLGMGALTFAFTNAEEARFWVEEYYDTFERECEPIGRDVNPNVAMLTGFMCHEDGSVARERAVDGSQFFAYGLGHFWRDGVHVPGRTDLWRAYASEPVSRQEAAERKRLKAGMAGIGTPEELIEHFRAFEAAGLDQLILLHQSGGYRHEHICESLQVFAERVLPEFKERDAERDTRKARAMEPLVARARAAIAPIEPLAVVPEVAAYPLLWKQMGAAAGAGVPDRRPGAAALWQLQVGGASSAGPQDESKAEELE